MSEEEIKWRYCFNYPWEVVKLSFFKSVGLSFGIVLVTLIMYKFANFSQILTGQLIFSIFYIGCGFLFFLIFNIVMNKLIKSLILKNETTININLIFCILCFDFWTYMYGFKYLIKDNSEIFVYTILTVLFLMIFNLHLYKNFYVNLFKPKEGLNDYVIDTNKFLEKTVFFGKK